MADISMCEGKGCENRVNCYRFLAKPDRFQSYGLFEEQMKDGKCNWYWEVNKGRKRNSAGTTEVI